jgi:hypothetical protein
MDLHGLPIPSQFGGGESCGGEGKEKGGKKKGRGGETDYQNVNGSIGLAGDSVGPGAISHQFDCTSCTASHFASPVTVFAEVMHLRETGSRYNFPDLQCSAVYTESQAPADLSVLIGA